ncbi:MAG: YfhO family protein, partial [Anaerolineales bacterium]|nr:YfhO family protein [Anaerolineales bacterium]
LSIRSEGLTFRETVSFSLRPTNLHYSLLPPFGLDLSQPLGQAFSEWVAYLGISGLALALLGSLTALWQPAPRRFIFLAACGLILSLGLFTGPLYLALYYLVPGFDLFRVPARWLLWYALAMALLAGLGYQRMVSARPGELRRPLLVGSVLLGLLILWGYLAVPLSRIIPMGAEAPAANPSWWSVVGWLLELSLFWLLASRSQNGDWFKRYGPLLVAAVALFLASRQLAYHRNVTAPSVYFSLRPPIARLQALAAGQGAGPAGRYLSQSGTLFDLGDQAEMDSIYLPQLDEAALWTLTVATKQQEVIAPNLSLSYGLSSVDGFDGGILPLRNYTLATSLLLPAGAQTTDGRLREFMTGVPDGRFLDLFGVTWLITDKVGDEWHEAEGLNVFYDLKHATTLAPGEAIAVLYIPAYEATALRLLANDPPAVVRILDRDGEMVPTTVRAVGDRQYQVDFAAPVTPGAIDLLNGPNGDLTLNGLALIDSRDSSFQTLVPGEYRLLYSGDVKIYENLDVLPRAFLVTKCRQVYSPQEAIALMERPVDPAFGAPFDPETMVMVESRSRLGMPSWPEGELAGQVTIEQYSPESMTLRMESEALYLLVITEANYPGWRASVDGDSVELFTVNGMFRGVWVPAGDHQIELRYAPAGFAIGRWISLLALAVLVSVWAWPMRRRRTRGAQGS